MTSEQLAAHVRAFIENAKNRVRGVGDQQYSSGDMQRFEVMPLAELLDWADEELQDVAVYAAMLSIRLERIRTAVLGPANPMFERSQP